MVKSSLHPKEAIDLIPRVLRITYIKNVGAAFGIFYGQKYFLLAVGIVVMAIVLYYHFKIPLRDKLTQIALALILGGSLSNFIDRLFMGYVIDMIDFRFWPVFNIADSLIVIGVGIILYKLFREKE